MTSLRSFLLPGKWVNLILNSGIGYSGLVIEIAGDVVVLEWKSDDPERGGLRPTMFHVRLRDVSVVQTIKED